MSFKRWWLPRRATQLAVILLILSPRAGLPLFQGNLASAVLFGVTLSDPLAALQVVAGSRVAVPAFLGSALLVTVVYLLLGGRTFCAWVCPVYLVTELADKVRQRLGSGETTYGLEVKHWVLLVTLVVTLITGLPLFEVLSPIGIITRALMFGAGTALWFIAGLLLMEVFHARRLWCRSLCPLGGLYALVGRFAPVKVRYHRAQCTHCGACGAVCPVEEVLAPSLDEGIPLIRSGECTRCGRCIDSCPAGALCLGMGYQK
jgi:ferredoxin-type protein NapH